MAHVPDTKYYGQVEKLLNRVFKRHDLSPPAITRIGVYILIFWLLGAAICFISLRPSLSRQTKIKLSIVQSWAGLIVKPTNTDDLKNPWALGFLGLCALPLIGQGITASSASSKSRYLSDANKLSKAQGRKHPIDLVSNPLKDGIPLGQYQGKQFGIKRGSDAGHVLVVAPTRSGKGLHLFGTMQSWRGAAVVVDPKREQYQRTSADRSSLGPIYSLPQHGIDLLDFFNVDDPLDFQELYTALLQTWMDNDPIFAQKAFAIFEAARDQSKVTGEHMLKIVGRWANTSVGDVVKEGEKYAPSAIAKFTDGNNEELNRFTLSAWGTFTAKFSTIAPHINTISRADIPRSWADQNSTIYICYPLDQLAAAGGLVSVILTGLIKGQQRSARKNYTLFAVDEAHSAAIHKLDVKLATVGGYGVTLLVYFQQLSQIREVYGRDASDSIIGNFHHQIFFATRDNESGDYVSKKFGTELQVSKNFNEKSSFSQNTHAALDASMIDSLPPIATIVFSDAIATIMQRVNPFTNLKSPLLPPLGITISDKNGLTVYDGASGRLLVAPKPRVTKIDEQALVSREQPPIEPKLQAQESYPTLKNDDQIQERARENTPPLQEKQYSTLAEKVPPAEDEEVYF